MKIVTIGLILFLTSSFLMLPLVKPTTEIVINRPFQIIQVIVNLTGEEFQISSEPTWRIALVVSQLDQEGGRRPPIFNSSFLAKETIKTPNRGHHLIELNSTKIVTIFINEKGIPISSIILIALAFLIWFAFFIRENFLIVPEY